MVVRHAYIILKIALRVTFRQIVSAIVIIVVDHSRVYMQSCTRIIRNPDLQETRSTVRRAGAVGA